jgi:SAM-dependent methyltransferase
MIAMPSSVIVESCFPMGRPAFDAWAPFWDDSYDPAPYVAFYRSVVGQGTRSVLDLGCGSGTITTELARGVAERSGGVKTRVVGVDESPEMLRVAAERDPGIEWVRGDLRSPPVDGHFDLVTCCYNTLQHLHSDDDLAQAFTAVRQRLAPAGVYAFDVSQPNLDWLGRAERDLLVREITDGEGRRLELREDRFYDPESLILTTDWRLLERGSGDGQPVARIRHELRQFFSEDLERGLATAGLAIRERYGDLDRSPFTAGSRRQVLVCGAN